MKRKSKVRSYKLVIGLLLLVFVVCLFSSGAISADKNVSSIEDARAVLEKWIETQRIISQEKRDWELGREILNQRIELVQREIESLRGKIDEAKESIAGADKKRAYLLL